MGNAAAFGLRVRGAEVRYNAAAQTLASLGRIAPLKPTNNRVKLRLLVDRTSLEVFGNGGQVSLTSCFLPSPQDKGLTVFAEGGAVQLLSLTAYPLHSAWPKAKTR